MNMTATKSETALINKIARRARAIYKQHGMKTTVLDIQMDLVDCHLSGCPLDLNKLAAFDDFNLMHDVQGINRHLNRTTGELSPKFLPRCAAPQK